MKKLLLVLMAVMLMVPAMLVAQSARTANLAWDQPDLTNVAGWKIYVSDTTGGPYTAIIDVPYTGQTEYTASYEMTVTGQGSKYFVCTAYNSEGVESGYSNEAEYQYNTVAPATPINLQFSIVIP